MITATDFFCGMGGSSTGLVEAGFTVKLAANHWARAIETHSANHPDTEHLCADLQAVDLRYLPKTDILWASPICTELSPAGGRRKKGHQLDLFEDHGHVPTAAFERTRVTFWEVIRACEIHRYKAVLIENVVEAADWELFDVWLSGMTALGYVHEFISVSAAHVGDERNPRAPQWRDRMYIRFTLKGIKVTPIEPRPLAWCFKCDAAVNAVQWWKPKRKHAGRTIGKYGAQYLYIYGGQLSDANAIGTTGTPLPPMRTTATDFLVIPYRKGAKPHDTERPLSAMTTREGHALMRASIDVDDCLFRMLKPRESATAQRFPRDYVITGNGGEQQMQSGNAVAVNVAHWLGADTARALEGDAA